MLHVHKHSTKRTIFDQMTDCFGGLGHGKYPVDHGLQRAFFQEFQESCVGCGYRL